MFEETVNLQAYDTLGDFFLAPLNRLKETKIDLIPVTIKLFEGAGSFSIPRRSVDNGILRGNLPGPSTI